MKMLIYLRLALILCGIDFVLCQCGFSFNKAKVSYMQQTENNEDLYEKFNLVPGDFTYAFNREFRIKNEDNKNGELLLEYQRILRKSKKFCCAQSFRDYIRSYVKCVPREYRCPATVQCDENAKFRTIGGFCNNLKNPNFGAVGMPYKHRISPAYADNIQAIRESVLGGPLPNLRAFGNDVAAVANTTECECTTLPCPCKCAGSIKTGYFNNHMSVVISQFATHDITARSVCQMKGLGFGGIQSCKKDNTEPLAPENINPYQSIPIAIPADDPHFSAADIRCMPYIRLQPMVDPECDVTYAQTQNLRSAYLDLSQFYSETPERTETLRGGCEGCMKTNENDILYETECADGLCYVAGDPRATQTPPLTVVHVLFNRMHNNIARNLGAINPHWDGNRIFDETRRILTAIYQIMIYHEWLPLVLGEPVCRAERLVCGFGSWPKCDKYNPNIDASSSPPFVHAAFRLAHKNIQDYFITYDENFNETQKFLISDLIDNNGRMLETRLSEFVKGNLLLKMRSGLKGYANQLRNNIFKTTVNGNSEMGVDLQLIDGLRDRDAGNRPYVYYFEWCGLPKVCSWKDLKKYFDDEEFEILKKNYKDVRDIDLMNGIMMEKQCETQTGPIATCIMAEQFYRFRYSDRFFSLHEDGPYPFTTKQLANLRQMTLARLICEVTDCGRIQKQALVVPIKGVNDYVNCSKLKGIDYSLYKEAQEC